MGGWLPPVSPIGGGCTRVGSGTIVGGSLGPQREARRRHGSTGDGSGSQITLARWQGFVVVGCGKGSQTTPGRWQGLVLSVGKGVGGGGSQRVPGC